MVRKYIETPKEKSNFSLGPELQHSPLTHPDLAEKWGACVLGLWILNALNYFFPIENAFLYQSKRATHRSHLQKSANMDSCRILKDKLNSGYKVNLDSKSMLIVASILKVWNL